MFLFPVRTQTTHDLKGGTFDILHAFATTHKNVHQLDIYFFHFSCVTCNGGDACFCEEKAFNGFIINQLTTLFFNSHMYGAKNALALL
jgi:hypothetical protein